MKKFALTVVAMGLAAMFTACGSDSSSSNAGSGALLSCDMKMHMSLGDVMEMNTHTCAEMENTASNKADVDEHCVSQQEEEEGVVMEMTAKKGSGCPSGSVLKCTDEDGVTTYFYDKAFANKSCDDLEDDGDFDFDF